MEKFHKEILTNNELFYASPLKVNDPFEMMISPLSLNGMTESDKEEFAEGILYGMQLHPSPELVAGVKKILMEDSEMVNEQFFQADEKFTGSRYGLISFSKVWNSAPMWAHYAEDHSGFCVGFDLGTLLGAINAGAWGPVSYFESLPSVKPFKFDAEALIAKTHYKSKQWEYEQEYRIVKLWADSDPTTEDRKCFFPSEAITEVILGMNVSTEIKEAIKSIAISKGWPVYQIKRDRNSFLLLKDKIS